MIVRVVWSVPHWRLSCVIFAKKDANRLSCPISELDEEAVRNFLRANPVFLEDYVMKHVDQDRLERWLIRKTRKLKNKGGKKPANSLGHENNKQSGK